MTDALSFRKKPVEIEAMWFRGDKENMVEILYWINSGEQPIASGFMTDDPQAPYILIETLEGDMRALVGDWIIKGIKGEFYPCKPDIFNDSYDQVTFPQEAEVTLGGKEPAYAKPEHRGSLGPVEIEHRFGFHRATIEGENATLPIHTDLRLNFREFGEYLDMQIPNGRAKSVMFTELENASMWAHKAVAETAPLISEEDNK